MTLLALRNFCSSTSKGPWQAVSTRQEGRPPYTKRKLDPMALPALTASAVRRLVTRTDNGEKFVMQCIGPSTLFVSKSVVLKAAYQLWYHFRCQATCSTRKQPHSGTLPASSQRWRALDECHAGDAAQPSGQGPSDRKRLSDTPQRHPGSGYA